MTVMNADLFSKRRQSKKQLSSINWRRLQNLALASQQLMTHYRSLPQK
jgi:hypothetical protein